MKTKGGKPLALNRETLRNLEDLSGALLREAAAGTSPTASCSCDCSACNRPASKSCCL
jgi:hypothetical protein